MIPAGPKNLQPLFPTVDFTQVQEYYVQLVDLSSGSGSGSDEENIGIIVTSPTYRRACCCSDDTFRLFWVNRLGQVDGINLKLLTEDLVVKSERWRKALNYPLCKFDGGFQRLNVESNESQVAENICFPEEDQEFLKEVLDAPNAWVQWTGTQGQADDYIPVVIEDGTFATRKENERYIYAFQVKFSFSNDNQGVRN